MTVALQSALVRVWNSDNQIIGAGFLVTESHILTCAHVVSDALDLPRQEMPANPVQLDFPFVAPGEKVTAVVTLWQPKRPDGTGDIAGLELQALPPDGARPLRLVSTPDTWNHPFRAFGFPVNRDQGVWASGVLRDRTANGHIQIEDIKTPGYSVQPGFSGTAVWDEALHGVVGMVVAAESKADTKAAFIIPTDKLIEAWPDLHAWATPPNPYRGLQAFRQEEADLFFGREAFVKQLETAVAHKPFVAVIGASGSGKSSVVFAGLLPRVGRETAVVSFRPGNQPFRALADALLPIWQPELPGNERLEEAGKLATNLQAGKTQLLEVVNDILQRQPIWKRLLLVADQFEELYTLCPQPEVKRAFVRCLITAVQAQAGQHSPAFTLLLTMRADFMGQATEERPLADALQDATRILGPMTREELALAVEKPAQAAGVQFEPGLVARILDDVGDEPGNLPLLEFALTLLWDKQTNGLLTHADYEAIGEVEGALARYAEEQFSGLKEAEQAQARLIFTQLVQPGRGTEDTRRQATVTEIGTANWRLVKWLADARLVVTNRNETGEETAEIAHEVLARRWQQLRNWMNVDRRYREWQERLREAMRQWQAADEDDEALLRGTLLAEAEGWLIERAEQLPPHERAFIDKSVAFQERARVAQNRRRNSVLAVSLVAAVLFAILGWFSYEQSQNLAAESTRVVESEGTAVANAERANIESTRAFANEGTAVAESTRAFANEETAIAERATAQAEAIRADQNLATAEYNEQLAVAREAEADSQRQEALLQSLAALAAVTYEQDENPELAILLGIEAVHLNQRQQADLDWLVDPPLRSILREYGYYQGTLVGHEAWVNSVAFAPNGQTLASSSNDGVIRLWDLDNPTAESVVLIEPDISVNSVAFAPNGQTLVSGSNDGTIRLWDLDNPTAESAVLIGHDKSVNSVAFAPNGQTLASGSNDGTIRLWDTGNLTAEPIMLIEDDKFVNSVVFAPNGQTLAGASNDGTIRLWNVGNLTAEPIALIGHEASVNSVAFAPNGQTLASSSNDGTIRLWDVGDPTTEPIVLIGHEGSVNSVAFAPNGQTLASGSWDGTVRLWDINNPTSAFAVLTGHEGPIWSVAFSPDGKTLASSSWDEAVRLWNMPNEPVGAPVRLAGHEGSVWSVDFAPNGQMLASGSDDWRIRLWDVNNLADAPIVLAGHEGPIWSVAFSPDGQMLASGSSDSTIRLWDLHQPETESMVLRGHEGRVNSVAIAPNGQTLASGSDDGTIILWNMNNLTAEPIVIDRRRYWPGRSVLSIAFSPDGQTLASSNDDGSIELWDVGNLTSVPRYVQVANKFIHSVVFSPNGQILASGSRSGETAIPLTIGNYPGVSIPDQIVLLYMDNLFSPQYLPPRDSEAICTSSGLIFPHGNPCVFIIKGGTPHLALPVTFTPNGQTLASGGTTIQLWNVGNPLATPVVLTGHNGQIYSIAFKPDGNILAGGTSDGTVWLWPTLESLVEFGCQQVGRNLSRAEWQRYLPGEPYRQTCPNLPAHPSVPQEQP